MELGLLRSTGERLLREWRLAAVERAEVITALKLDKENLEGRVEELKVLSRTHQAQIQKLEGENSYFRARAEVTGKSLHELQMENGKLQEENRELKKGRPLPDFVKWWRGFSEDTRQNLYAKFPCGDLPVNSANRTARTILEWVAKDDCSASWDRYMAAEEWKKRMVKAEDRVKELETDRNVEVKCSSCHTTSKVDLDSMVCGKCHEVVKRHAHYAVDEEAEVARHHDKVIDEILDILEPEFYDPNTPAAQSGYDYDAMFRGLAKMKALAQANFPSEDFAERIAEEIAHGHTDEEILEGIAEDDHVDLVALIRKLMEKT